MNIRVGIIGKTNTGKTTFFNSATLQQADVSNYSFTTKVPNIGTAYTVSLCVCRELGVSDSPVNSKCVDGWRYAPIELVDLPGLIKGASEGKGLGNQFLSVASQSDALIHVVDSSGSIDEEGKIADPGTGDPVKDFEEIEGELVSWYQKIIENNRERIKKHLERHSPAVAISEPLKGMRVSESDVDSALASSKLEGGSFDSWTGEQLWRFTGALREVSKPTIVVANKMDLPGAVKNYRKLRDSNPDLITVPASAEAELALRKAEQAKLIKYSPGDESFMVINEKALSERQRWALQHIQNLVFREFMRTGVQFAINTAVFKLLRMNVVYPVYDPEKFADKHGHVLPDAYLLRDGSNISDLAQIVHTQLAKGLLYAVDARSKLRLPNDYRVADRDVLSLVTASQKAA
jgi:ribosome-binding ATPase YchF (GTP1/OBG family)